jgi:polyhydroxybutyrate depolymerase
VLHGGGGTAKGMIPIVGGGFEPIADREGFLVVYPDGIEKRWNDGRTDFQPPEQLAVDDVGFIAAILDQLEATYTVDKNRVYSTGISNGGFMSFRLACDLSDRFVAIAPVAASMGKALSQVAAPKQPVSVLMIHGDEDPLVPYSGGTVGFPRGKPRGECLGVDATMELWSQWNACPAKSLELNFPNLAPFDQTRTVARARGPGTEGAEVVACTVTGGGHTWPGGKQYLPVFLVGRTARDFNACEVIWRFFTRHVRGQKS